MASPKDHLAIIKQGLEEGSFEPSLGTAFYALANAWYHKFVTWCELDAAGGGGGGGGVTDEVPSAPGAIDNSSIAHASLRCIMKRGIAEGQEYTWMPADLYTKLEEWYGAAPAAQTFRRVAVATAAGNTKIDAYPQYCEAVRIVQAGEAVAAAAAQPAMLLLPRSSTTKQMLEAIRGDEAVMSQLGLADCSRSSLRLWMRTPASEDILETPMLLVGGASSLDALAKNEEVSKLLLEKRNADGSWPQGLVFAAAADYPRVDAENNLELRDWALTLEKGSLLDALDDEQKWFEASITDVILSPAGNPMDDTLHIHFRSWSHNFDVHRKRGDAMLKKSLLPPGSKTHFWRYALRPGDKVQAKLPSSVPGQEAKWHAAYVVAVDNSELPPRVQVMALVSKAQHMLSIEDDSLAWKEVHKVEFTETPLGVPPPLPLASFAERAFAEGAKLSKQAASSGGTAALPTAPAVLAPAKKRSGWSLYGNTDDDEQEDDRAEEVASAQLVASGGQAAVAAAAKAYYFKGAGGQVGSSYGYGGYGAVSRGGSVARAPGFCGLENLGNTCFMNSMLQCLSNVMELSDYFLNDSYLSDINTDNVLGAKGAMAHAYGSLMHAMWSGQFGRVSPMPVKTLVAKKAPQFVGWGQHDSQEFMSFLLDLLLEDLCRIKKKPTVEAVETAGRPEALIAQESWENYRKRNDSKVADVLAGLFRSHVRCNQCARESTTFDPFTSLSVPIPIIKWEQRLVFYMGSYNKRPMKFKLMFKASEGLTVRQVAEFLCRELPKEVEKRRAARRAAVPAAGTGAGAAADGSSLEEEQTEEGVHEKDDDMPAGPDEILVGVNSSRPCIIRQVAAHWLTVSEALELGRERAGVYDSSSLHLFAYRVRGSGQREAVTPALLLAPEALPAGAKPTITYIRSPGEALASDVAKQVLQADSDWDMDVHMPVARAVGGSEEEESRYGSGKRVSRAGKVFPVPSLSSGPRPHDYAEVWVRSYAGGKDYGVAGDPLIVSLHHVPGLGALPAGKVMTNRQFHAGVLATLRRLLNQPLALDASKEDFGLPYQLWAMPFNYAMRDKLEHDYYHTGLDTLESNKCVPCDEEAFEHSRARQLVVDIGKPGAWWNAREAGSSDDSLSVRAQPTHSKISLDTCLRQFSQEEQLGEQDKWYCGSCKEHVQAFKKMDVWKLPPVLIVHLKRFQYERGFFSSVLRGKIDDPVEFPTRGLDLSPYVLGPQASGGAGASGGDGIIYDLFAVSEHSGGMGGGHYTAHGFNTNIKRWLSYNDSFVGEAREEDCRSSAAYVLFYRQRNPANAHSAAMLIAMEPASASVAAAASGAGIEQPMADSEEDGGNPSV